MKRPPPWSGALRRRARADRVNAVGYANIELAWQRPMSWVVIITRPMLASPTVRNSRRASGQLRSPPLPVAWAGFSLLASGGR